MTVANRVVGMVVDVVFDVVAVHDTAIKPAPKFSVAMATEHIIHIASVEQDQQARMLFFLNIGSPMANQGMGLFAADSLTQ